MQDTWPVDLAWFYCDNCQGSTANIVLWSFFIGCLQFSFIGTVELDLPPTIEPKVESPRLRVLFIASNPPGTAVNHSGLAQKHMTKLLTPWTEFKAVSETTWEEFRQVVCNWLFVVQVCYASRAHYSWVFSAL